MANVVVYNEILYCHSLHYSICGQTIKFQDWCYCTSMDWCINQLLLVPISSCHDCKWSSEKLLHH